MTQKHQLAQLNIADAKGELSSEVMQGFTNRLDEINGLAENLDGFIWRYKDEEDPDIADRIFGNPHIIINISIWTDIDSLRQFVYKSTHKELIQGRKHWFNKMPEMHQVMWWVPEGHIPSIKEAKEKLDLLRKLGPTVNAFSFANAFEPQDNNFI